MSQDAVPEPVWDLMKQRLGYDDEQMRQFKDNPRNAEVLAKGMDMAGKTIVFEVVESQGCNSQHTVGTRFYFTGDGNLITKMAPSRICAFAMPVMTQAIFAIGELFYAGVDPDAIRFRRGGCFDVGVECGGWGNVVMEARVMDRDAAQALHEGASA